VKSKRAHPRQDSKSLPRGEHLPPCRSKLPVTGLGVLDVGNPPTLQIGTVDFIEVVMVRIYGCGGGIIHGIQILHLVLLLAEGITRKARVAFPTRPSKQLFIVSTDKPKKPEFSSLKGR